MHPEGVPTLKKKKKKKECVKPFKLLNYADNTSTSHSGHDVNKVIQSIEKDAKEILQFMASMILVAIPSTTEFMLIDTKER